jgi:hypothetical protein
MVNTRLHSILLVLLALGAGSCTHEDTGNEMKRMHPPGIDAEVARALAGQRIFFAHQSVGADILAGIAELTREGEFGVRIVSADSTGLGSGPGIYETRIGRNGDPRGKIDGFVRLLDGGIGRNTDIAIFKLCYADIDEDTDVAALFAHYKSALADLRTRYPAVRFVHVTVPLEGSPPGPVSLARGLAKKLLGRERIGIARNMRREALSDRIRAEYAGKEPVFDLARIEGTRPNGGMAVQTLDGRAVPCLASEYTLDGGHLNDRGRRVVAQRLLVFLAGLAGRQSG